jgi:hypothetical protein
MGRSKISIEDQSLNEACWIILKSYCKIQIWRDKKYSIISPWK